MKIGDYEVPESRISTILEEMGTLYMNMTYRESSSERVASLLGYSKRTNAFYRKLADLKLYGLVEHYKNKIRVSQLAKEAVAAQGKYKYDVLMEVMRNVPLWNRILNEFGENIPKDGFATTLALYGNIATPEAENLADSVRRAFEEDLRFINWFKPRKKVSTPVMTLSGMPNQDVSEPAVYVQYPGVEIRIEDEASIEIARQLFEAIVDKMNRKKV